MWSVIIFYTVFCLNKTKLKIPLICEITVHGIRKKSIFLDVDLGSKTFQYTELYQLEIQYWLRSSHSGFSEKHVSKKISLYETVIVSANDLLVQLFLDGKIKFLDIERYLKRVIKLKEFNKFKHISPTSVNQIIKLNKYVRLKTQSLSVLS